MLNPSTLLYEHYGGSRYQYARFKRIANGREPRLPSGGYHGSIAEMERGWKEYLLTHYSPGEMRAIRKQTFRVHGKILVIECAEDYEKLSWYKGEEDARRRWRVDWEQTARTASAVLITINGVLMNNARMRYQKRIRDVSYNTIVVLVKEAVEIVSDSKQDQMREAAQRTKQHESTRFSFRTPTIADWTESIQPTHPLWITQEEE